MQTFYTTTDASFNHALLRGLTWAGTPEIKFTVDCEQKVKAGDRLQMGKTKNADGTIVTVYYEITAVISRQPGTGLYANDVITANTKRITL
jgi:hypothetical protein